MAQPNDVKWLNSHYQQTNSSHHNKTDFRVKVCKKQCLVNDRLSLTLVTVTVFLVLLQVFSLVSAGPVLLSSHNLHGAVTLARNIRHLPCISRKTGLEGVCMFAIDCLKSNGSHLGTCIDRFYFGSCCQLPDKTAIPQIVSNNIDDNTIDNTHFVHPQTENKPVTIINKKPVPNKPLKKPVTTENDNKIVTSTNKPTTAVKTETPAESKIDNIHTIQEIKDTDEETKLTTLVLIETTTKDRITEETTKTSTTTTTTEVPMKLSTFQTVSGELSHSTEKPNKPIEQLGFTEANKITLNETTTTVLSTTAIPQPIGTKPYTTKKPIRTTPKPTYKPRPTLKPSNFTRPQYFNTTPRPLNLTNRPRPTKPVSAFNITRIPPYKPPPKRPIPTKKPIPIPPRLNITILPQSTSTRPLSTKPASTTITHITTTVSSTPEPKVETTTLSTTTSSTSTTTTTTEKPSSTTASSTTQSPSTEQSSEKINLDTSSIPLSPTETITTDKSTTTSTSLEPVIETTKATTTTTEAITKISSTEKEIIKEPVSESSVTEKSTLKPSTMVEISSSSEASSQAAVTDFPPGLVTWSNSADAPTKAPEPSISSTEADEIWSPITPPEGWILISTIPPKPETTSTTTTSTTKPQPLSTTTESPLESSSQTTTTTQSTSTKPTTTSTTSTTEATTVIETEPTTETELTTSLTPIESTTVVENEIPEFTVFITTSEEPLNTVVESDIDNSTTVSSEVTSSNFSESTTVSTTANVTVSSTESNNFTESSSTIAPLNATKPVPITTASPVTEEPINMTDFTDVCGRRLWPEGRIVGGAKSGFGRWPWQISLRQWRTSTYLHKCGAALLNENWAITAAHCVEHVPPSELLVRLGEHDLANENEPYGFAERRIQIVASHPHFDPATFEYDLALLRFYEPVTFQPNILPVCVPDSDDDFVGKNAYVTGWGRLYDEGPLPSVLQEVSVPVINNTACEAMYKVAGYDEHIPNIFICAGWNKGGSDSCEGDSGGPMVLQRDRDKRFILGGVISWGIGCAEPNQPGVYTRISEFRDWINQILQF